MRAIFFLAVFVFMATMVSGANWNQNQYKYQPGPDQNDFYRYGNQQSGNDWKYKYDKPEKTVDGVSLYEKNKKSNYQNQDQDGQYGQYFAYQVPNTGYTASSGSSGGSYDKSVYSGGSDNDAGYSVSYGGSNAWNQDGQWLYSNGYPKSLYDSSYRDPDNYYKLPSNYQSDLSSGGYRYSGNGYDNYKKNNYQQGGYRSQNNDRQYNNYRQDDRQYNNYKPKPYRNSPKTYRYTNNGPTNTYYQPQGGLLRYL